MPRTSGRPIRYKIIIGILLVATLISFSFTVFLYIKGKNAEPSKESVTTVTTYTAEEVNVMIDDAMKKTTTSMLEKIKTEFAGGSSTVSLLRSLYPENLIYYDTDRYVFASILSTITKNDLKASNFAVSAEGEMSYSENGKITSHKGIDVSKFQGTIDWDKVKKSGVEFAMIRAGYRSYGKGVITDDDNMKQNISGASKAGLDVGVYFFSQAVTIAEANEEADYVLSKIKGYTVNYPIVMDLEEIANDSYRQENLTPKELTDICIAFCDKIKAAGYTPMVYSNLKGFVANLELERLNSYEKWFAYYDTELYFPYQLSMWQYSESGKVDGITGNLDLDISFKTWK